MHQPNWRPHKRGSSGQDWTPADWDEFSEAEQIFYWKKKNRGLKRKQRWADKKAGLNPKKEKEKRQRETQEEPHEGQHPTESNDTDAAATAALHRQQLLHFQLLQLKGGLLWYHLLGMWRLRLGLDQAQ